MMDKRPVLIAQWEGVADVIAAVNLQQQTPRRARCRTQRCGLRCRPFAWGLANFAEPTEEEKVLVQRNGILDSISFTVARATIPTNYWVSG